MPWISCAFALLASWLVLANLNRVEAHSQPAPTAPVVLTGTIAYSRVVSATPSYEVRYVNSDATNDHFITAGWRPRISPDGNWMLFQREGIYPSGTGDQVYMRDLTLLTNTHVVTNSDYIVGTAWMTDSQHFLVDAACSIYRVNRNGTGVTDLTHAHSCYDDSPSVNPINGRIAFHNQFMGGLTANPDGSQITVISNTKASDWWFSWSKDGQWLSFLRGANYYKIHLDGSGLTQLTFESYPIKSSSDYGPQVPHAPAIWSDDGQTLVAPGTRRGVQGIYVIAADGSGTTTLLLASPPGTWVDFVGSVNGNATVQRVIYLPILLR